MKTFVDNFCRQVVERHLLNPLPQIFCPEEVAGMDDYELHDIAAESSENIALRKELKDMHENLQRSLLDLHK